jgi:peptide/nickel transport system ATP-binding protein
VGEICELEEPPLVEVEPEHLMRCHIPIEELRRLQATVPESEPLATTSA